MKDRRGFFLQGWALWGVALVLAFALPGTPWRAAGPPAFPWSVLPLSALLLGALVALGAGLAWLLGPGAARSRFLALWEAPPDLLWGGLVLAFWPRTWGPPGVLAWAVAFLLAVLPSEVRWLSLALPGEHPLPMAWGARAVRRTRTLSLARLVPRWIAARLPLWITSTLVLERMLSLQGLGSDWMARVGARDRFGLAVWIAVYAALWTLAQGRESRA